MNNARNEIDCELKVPPAGLVLDLVLVELVGEFMETKIAKMIV